MVLALKKSDCDESCTYRLQFILYKQKTKLGKRAPEEYIENFSRLPKKLKERFEGSFSNDDFSISLGYSSFKLQYKADKTLTFKWNGKVFQEVK